ncbi:anthranilate phosphoribosyltransferase [Listeria monocytogenes]|uniref:anthranilate phosphoribosyltransferase n=1 Tax=Listeria monocytogenes TaxID=1639 RepID=UPI0004DACA5E|nr:anthranilate phosphoribosyltransferase [Listeria monocytogenes]EAC4949073.1 anthranilate phosphoribosyltransferase [Listeria monocytogenes]EAC5341086.1 anthranilate phosphoribosyltransferase [Listeria monocytogenes]EAC5502985.1 anthranilate phosphoribosyltransferase [Listeria monocytogenes]EAC6509901.1 anthranilate phosphoribosyltransferase [Listeria monocytogenes]EAC7146088.1 anthranilate phosphoribosyltransferase [Listeria monocytogenes]
MEILLQKVYDQENLSKEEMNIIATEIFEGRLSKTKMAAFLMALKVKGETAEEMAGIAQAMQQVAIQVAFPAGTAMDNCGTGGDKSNSFNISTTSAFVLAAAGIPVAKHGNRSISSRSGSADVCQELGIDINLRPEDMTYLLEKVGIAFLFAPHVHPNMKYVMDVRKELGTPTIFNLIGPLTNPVHLETQLMGIYRRDLLEQTAEVLGQLGRKRAVVLNGAGFMDEASLAGENHYALYENGEVHLYTLRPEDVGLTSYPLEAITGGDAKENAAILRSVLEGEPGAYLDTVLLNAGFGLFANGKVGTVQEGVDLAKDLISSGLAKQKLADLITYQKEVLAK